MPRLSKHLEMKCMNWVAAIRGFELLCFGMGVNRYTMVNGRILQNQDWGNILFGIYGREAGFPRILLAIGAGYAQITTTPDWRWGDWMSFFDDPRDQRYIFEGYR